jgi:hypothetical protein
VSSIRIAGERPLHSHPRAHGFEVEPRRRVDPTRHVGDGEHDRALRDQLLRRDPTDVPEALHDATLLGEVPAEPLAGTFDHHHDARAGRLVPEERAAERDRLAGDDLRHGITDLHRVRVHDPRHGLLVRGHVWSRDVFLRPDHTTQLARVPPRQALQLAQGEVTRIAAHAPLRATVGQTQERALPGHPDSERSAFAEGDVRVVADSALRRTEHARVLDAVGRKDVDRTLVAANRNRHHHSTLWVAEPLRDRLVHLCIGNRLLELRHGSPKERRVPLEGQLLGGKLLELGHARSLGSSRCRGGLCPPLLESLGLQAAVNLRSRLALTPSG